MNPVNIAIAVLLALGIVAGSFSYFYALLSGGTASSVAGSSGEHARIIRDLGAHRRTFTNYSPWRFRFGALMLVSGAICGAVGELIDLGGLRLVACFLLGGGIIAMLYVAFMRLDKLELYARGLVLREGKTNAKAVYYSDISSTSLNAVVCTVNGVEASRMAKSLVVVLYEGSFDIGTVFPEFNAIDDAIREYSAACSREHNLVGNYLVSGRNINTDEPMEVEIEARSPHHSRTLAFDRYGLTVDMCQLKPSAP